MKHYIQGIKWTFCDSTSTYPDVPNEKIIIRSPEDVFKNFQSLFRDHVSERFVVLWLSASNRVTGFEVVTEGTLTASLVHPREVFRSAIVATCASIIVAHNHPSGNPEPSREDLDITRQIVESGKIIGIPVYDHILFAQDTFTSFAKRGLL